MNRMWRVMKKEWGAATFVITVLIGAVAVAVSLLVNGSHSAAIEKPPPCPSYSPWPTLTAGQTVPPLPSSSPTPFNAAYANCPTPPPPPTNPPTPTPVPTPTFKPGQTPTPTPGPTALPTAIG